MLHLKKTNGKGPCQLRLLQMLLFALLICLCSHTYGQVPAPADTLKTDSTAAERILAEKEAQEMASQYDLGDLVRKILRRKTDLSGSTRSGVIIIPNVASNPSIGSQIGIKAVAGKKFGRDPNTLLSVGATSASITTKGIIYFYISHNIYTSGNKWNFQGSLVAAKTVTPDYGLGIGRPTSLSETEHILNNPDRRPRGLRAQFYNFREKVYKEVSKNLFVGGGVSFDIRRKIDERDTTNSPSPYNIYSDRHGFKRDHYMANGILLNVQYTTRDNQNRAYNGIYLDAGFRANQKWMASSRNALQFTTDFRKYVSLSSRRPEHVVAFWNWNSFLLAGNIPYLELAGTAKDPGSRSGRGYTVGYFKGTQYSYSEVEYRFPILNNNFLSGVAFFHLQTTNDEAGTKVFQVMQPGGGAGLRILFNKVTRTNLCLDYAFGKFGARGFFLGLNEAF
ncbi:BamA/TamA family outer membrane protein [Chitinophaga rhizophila]|uniref:BamA/TamA family outer membrane protein n=1 Tax=Chitinophaga rhizophila TaxID=2866212 RepID=A0ABS7GBZ8_9BACT|nr:BamA/TamA family outer membrane protein [Chitinophaga rhizophila]MBW8685197.1 BamA/TamA family outer membrane protein [Chitinophaga rhizophila]